MRWQSEKCGQKLNGKEKFCPECVSKAIYKCKSCGKILDNGKHNYCPICSTERSERRGDALKKAGEAVVTVGSIAMRLLLVENLVGENLNAKKRFNTNR